MKDDKPQPIDWPARRANARAFLTNKPKKGHAWTEQRYEYDAAPARPAREEGA